MRGLTACTLIFLSFNVFFLPLPSANAIFGLSTCEKLKSSINSQYAIGYELWKTYESTWKLHVKSPKDTQLNTHVIEAISNLYNSDLAIFAMALKHSNCFNPAQNSHIITSQTETKRNLARAQSWLNPNNLTWDKFWTDDFYSGYSYLLQELKSVK